jgi:hypothetical protein
MARFAVHRGCPSLIERTFGRLKGKALSLTPLYLHSDRCVASKNLEADLTKTQEKARERRRKYYEQALVNCSSQLSNWIKH